MVSLIKGDEMELNIKWVEIREVNVLRGRCYFVAYISNEGEVVDFCIAYKVLECWRLNKYHIVHFKVTHACLINEVTHKISPPSSAIGDKVVISTSIEEYKAGSVGEIVGKYDKTRTWCIRMEDNFVILLKDKWFKHYYPGGE